MHLTKRFFTMNALVVLLSVGLTVLAVIIFVAAHTKVFGNEADTKEVQKAFEGRAAISQIKREAQTLKFEELLDATYQQELADRVNALGASAIILKIEM